MTTTIPQKELRNNVGAVLRRVEAGEAMTVTVAGRPVAELRPAQRRAWVSGAALRDVWAGAAPRQMEADIATLSDQLVDPFEEK